MVAERPQHPASSRGECRPRTCADSASFCERTVGMRSRFPTIMNEVEAQLLRSNRASPYFTLLRPNYLDDLIRIEGLHRGGALLEIGGYPFYFSMCLLKLGVDLTTVDLAPQRASELIRECSLRVVACDIERAALPFNDHSFATIMLCATFEHLRVDPLFALEEMRRVLQPGGLLYLTTPNLYRLGNIASFALGRGLAFDPIHEYGKLRTVGHMGHVREYTASEIRGFLGRAGFARVGVKMRATPSRRGKLVDAVQWLLPGTRSELVVTARTPPRATGGI
jgi:SAM-dependent methyltransferase